MRILLAVSVCIMLCAALGTAQPVTIGGLTYDKVDPGDEFTAAKPAVQDWTAPAATAAEAAAGMMAFVTADPGDYKPDRIPKDSEHRTSLATFLTPGEDEAVWVGVYGLAELSGLSLEVGTGNAPLAADVRHEHFWPQRTGWRSRQWYVTPELLLPCAEGKRTVPTVNGLLEERAFDLKAGETAAFWLTLSAPADAAPGEYECTVTIRAAGRQPLVLPLTVEVLPIRLQTPADRYWPLYADTSRWNVMSDEQVLAELRDFKRHGVTGLVEMPLGTPDLSELKAGKVTFDASAYRRIVDLCGQAGLLGPHVCSYGGTPERVRDALGITCDLGKDEWPQAIKDGVEAISRAAVEATRDAPGKWYFYGVDEPGGDNTYAIQEYQCWRRGGAETYATFYNLGFLEKASEFLTAPCFVSGLVSGERPAREAREACRDTGAEFWWYGTGCYVNPYPQEGFMWHNRYGAGFLLWKTGAKAAVAWTFCRPHEDVFNDFDGSAWNAAEPKEQATTYPHLLKPGDFSTYQGAIPTLAWESLREGVDDYKYLYTLTTLIEQARRSDVDAARRAAKDAEATLTALVEAVPWGHIMGPVAFETSRIQQARRGIADIILKLQDVLAGKPAAEASRPVNAQLLVRTAAVDSAESAPLPAIAVNRAAEAPSIDGDSGDACWKASAVAEGFRVAGDGRPAAVKTQARILYDDAALYVAFDCAEPAMDELVAKQSGHDTPMVWVDDGIELFLAGADRSRYAHFIVNTNGSLYDELGQDPAWNPDVKMAVAKQAAGWSVEFSIPWAELEKAGIPRAEVLAANFCRNRFAGGENAPHSAWSCPYGGFHAPERFGFALVQEGLVALAGVRAPALWGPQTLALDLHNPRDVPVEATASVAGGAVQRVALMPHGTRTVELPVDLRVAGKTQLVVEWGAGTGEQHSLSLGVSVPEPMTIDAPTGLVADGDELTLTVRLGMAPAVAQQHRVRVRIKAGRDSRSLLLPCRPGETAQVPVRVAGRARIETELVDAAGQAVFPAQTCRLVAAALLR